MHIYTSKYTHLHTQVYPFTLASIPIYTRKYTYLHPHTCVTSPPRANLNFFTHFAGKEDHQYLNGEQLACEVQTWMCEVLTKSGLSFTYKMIHEIFSMPRVDSGYPHNFIVNSWVFKDDKSKSEAKLNSRPGVCPLLVEGLHFVCVEHAKCLLLAYRVSTSIRIYAHKYTLGIRLALIILFRIFRIL